ncbi:hypothetical protein O4H49_14395 [Kiloniella laminariae]|uniref:Uncharacterized protein n=1 Tax=Kiloniella laminariae TaxID=454162 RepID=A0ABT4LLJ0_9PROT|nr:hypothetical protein [Kiloniella laminariae]MCZ4281978.1 hypothetical protein [Kiloniella laminariae]
MNRRNLIVFTASLLSSFIFAPVLPITAMAGEADVLSVEAVKEKGGSWRFNVSVRHDDTGWDHYADKWEIVSPEGLVLGTRVLHHPHENEQPFTRSLSGVVLPQGVTQVIVRAHDKVHGLGGIEKIVVLE